MCREYPRGVPPRVCHYNNIIIVHDHAVHKLHNYNYVVTLCALPSARLKFDIINYYYAWYCALFIVKININFAHIINNYYSHYIILLPH